MKANLFSRTYLLTSVFTVIASLGVSSSSWAEEIKRKLYTPITVYKSPTCGCCTKWVDHLKRDGFRVTVQDMNDVNVIKDQQGVDPMLRSCHTAIVDGYTIEGHVPMNDIWALLQNRPQVSGIAVPGMPMGSPGMEGSTKQPFDVYTFDGTGKTSVFAKH